VSANAVSGPHGRETSLAEATQPARNPALTFHEVLSALNPLQYLPVVGTIYRAVTGDVGNPQLHVAGSLVGGLLTGGPIGALTSLVGIVADHFLHFDRIAAALFGKPAAVATTTSPVPDAAPTPISPMPISTVPASVAAAAVSAYARANGLAWREA